MVDAVEQLVPAGRDAARPGKAAMDVSESAIGRANGCTRPSCRSNSAASSVSRSHPARTSAATVVDFPLPEGAGMTTARPSIAAAEACTQTKSAVRVTASVVTLVMTHSSIDPAEGGRWMDPPSTSSSNRSGSDRLILSWYVRLDPSDAGSRNGEKSRSTVSKAPGMSVSIVNRRSMAR